MSEKALIVEEITHLQNLLEQNLMCETTATYLNLKINELKKLALIDLSFGEALEAAKQGKRICRNNWNGKEQFVFMRPSQETNISLLVQNIKTIPQSVKDYLCRQTAFDVENRLDSMDIVKFTPYLCLWNAQKEIVNGWNASQSDMLATDWCVLD